MATLKTNGTTEGVPSVIRCAAYLRKSNRKNLNLEFNSLDAQYEAIKRYVAGHAHDGWELLDEKFEDGGVSGKDTNRPGWQRLLKRVAQGGVDRIVVYKLDRAFRSLRDYLHHMESLQGRGVQLCSVTEPFTVDSAFGRAMGNLLATLGQLERELVGERIRDNVAERIRLGKYVGGMAPYGYTINRSDPNHKHLALDPLAAENVRFIYTRYLECLKPSVVVDELAQRDQRMQMRRGDNSEIRKQRAFNVSDIRRFLSNPVYMGVTVDRQTGETFKGEHPAIIAPDLYAKVQEACAINRSRIKSRNRTGVDGLLKGLALCGECGCLMRLTWGGVNKGRKYRYYVCSNVIRQKDYACERRYYAADILEQATIDYLRGVFRSPEVSAKVLRGIRQERLHRVVELEQLQRKMADVGHRQQGTTRLEDDCRCSGEFVSQLNSMAREHERVSTQVARLTTMQVNNDGVLQVLRNLDEIWDVFQPAMQSYIARTLLESVTVYDGRIRFRLRVSGLRALVDELVTGSGSGSAGKALQEVSR